MWDALAAAAATGADIYGHDSDDDTVVAAADDAAVAGDVGDAGDA